MLLAHRSWGDGADKVALLVHRGRDSSTTWKKVGPRLADQGWHAIAVDLRGHGDSGVDLAACDRSLSTPAGDLVETIAALRPDKQSVDLLVGHAFGALVSLTCAVDHPGFAKRLVLEEPPGPNFDPEKGSEATARLIRLARENPGNPDVLPEKNNVEPDELADKAAAAAAADPDYLPEVIRGFADLDLYAVAGRCSVPTLLVLGRDKGEPFGEGWPTIANYSILAGADRANFRNAFPKAEMIEMEAGHYVHTKALPEFIAAIEAWSSKTVI
jgi:pimeloyl-ACP methyl ester carboxylesterase